MKKANISRLLFFLLVAVTAAVQIACGYSAVFAEHITQTAGKAIRTAVGFLFAVFPFSVSELLLYAFFPVLLFFFLRAVKKRRYAPFLRSFFLFLATLYFLFTFTMGAGYHRIPLTDHLWLDESAVTEQTYYRTLNTMKDELNALAGQVRFSESGASVCPYGFQSLARKVLLCADRAEEKFPFFAGPGFAAKPILLSEPLTYLHLSGIYGFYTAEANINTNYPDYILPYTMAHEYAHQRGISREEEANFMAFLVCRESDDPYIRYSGLANLFASLLNTYYDYHPENFYKIRDAVDERVLYDYKSYSLFFEKYSESKASKVSETLNDGYLKLNGQEGGILSYDDTVTLTVAYYEKQRGGGYE